MSEPIISKQVGCIKSEAELRKLTNSILKSFSNVKIETADPKKEMATTDTSEEEFFKQFANVNYFPKKKMGTDTDCKNDSEEEKMEWHGVSMFYDVAKMQQSMNIKDTELEKQLIELEKQLISKGAKKHISRRCQATDCKKVAPDSYPNNIYLCETHRASLCKQLEQHQVPCNQGSVEERKKCRQLRRSYQKVIDSLKVADADQSFGGNQHKYPKQYFSVAMAKLILCQQELNKPLPPNADQTLKDSRRKMKKIVKHLMDLLIVARQNLNCHWCCVCAMIISVCTCIGGGVAWIAVNVAYVTALYSFLGFFVEVMIAGVVFGDTKMKWVSGAAMVGGVVGYAAGGYATMASIEQGGQLGAYLETMFGPGAGTAAGAAVGAVCGGLFAGGCAVMYKYRNLQP